jgi:hypothetical protein
MTFPVLGIPNATDIPSQSQAQIQTNFNSIIGWAAVDHLGYGAANAGTHNQVTFSGVTSQSVPTDPEAVLYTKNDTSSHPQLFFLNSQNSTFYNAASNGCTVLMGGILLQWGNVTVPAGGSATFTFPVTFPNNVFVVTVTCRAVGAFKAGFGTGTNSAIPIYLESAAGGSQNVCVMAIGN